MSANNQTLIKKYKGKWYVFTDVMAESWGKKNKLFVKEAKAICDTLDEAYDEALKLDEKCGEFKQGTEYGVQFNRLCKDDAKVEIKE